MIPAYGLFIGGLSQFAPNWWQLFGMDVITGDLKIQIPLFGVKCYDSQTKDW